MHWWWSACKAGSQLDPAQLQAGQAVSYIPKFQTWCDDRACMTCPLVVPCLPALQSKEAAKGRFWFIETDLKSGTAIRMDKTGKSILMLLRHLGRLQEVRGTKLHV